MIAMKWRGSPKSKLVRRILLFLLLLSGGAIVNVAVAWVLAYGVDGWRTDALIFDLETTTLARTPTGRLAANPGETGWPNDPNP